MQKTRRASQIRAARKAKNECKHKAARKVKNPRDHPLPELSSATLQAGDVVIGSFSRSKHRPWLVVWCDDFEDQVCLILLTRQTQYAGTVATGHNIYSAAGSWAMIQPLAHVATFPRTGVRFNAEERRRVAAEVGKRLDLGGDDEPH